MPTGELRGGAELQLLQLVEHRKAAMLDLHVAFLERGELVDACAAAGSRTTVVPAGRLRDVSAAVRAIATIARIVWEEEAELVIGWMAKGYVYGGLAALATRRPGAWLQPGLPDRSAIDRVARRIPAQLVITVSEYVDRAQRAIAPSQATEVIYPGVDGGRFDPDRLPDRAALRRRLGLPAGPIVGSVGRLQHWKGFHHLVAAMPAVLARHPSAHLVIVGGTHAMEPGYEPELRARIAALGMTERVTLAGRQDNPEEWMRAMDVFVHTSTAEPFGMVVIEAMSVGTAVVASCEAGPTEVITPGVDGELWPRPDEGKLATAIVRLLADDGARTRIAGAGRRRAGDFSVDQFARRFGAAMERAVSAGRTSSQ